MNQAAAGPGVALVTGGNRGIGRESARRLVEAGYRVYLGARDPEAGRTAAEEIGAHFIALDVTSDESVGHAVREITDAEGHLDVLVNNAGITGPIKDIRDYTPQDVLMVYTVNVVGYVRMIHAFLPLLEKSGDPRIVNVSSGLGSFGRVLDEDRMESRFGSPVYSSAKAAINMITARYARELPNIRINVADPGLTATDFSGGRGHSVQDGTDAVLGFALAGPGTATGTFRDRLGVVPW